MIDQLVKVGPQLEFQDGGDSIYQREFWQAQFPRGLGRTNTLIFYSLDPCRPFVQMNIRERKTKETKPGKISFQQHQFSYF
jgi:hypothetical protein